MGNFPIYCGRTNSMEKRLDKRLDAIAKLLRQGMRILVRIESKIEELATAQKQTRRDLKAFVKSLHNGPTGRNDH